MIILRLVLRDVRFLMGLERDLFREEVLDYTLLLESTDALDPTLEASLYGLL